MLYNNSTFRRSATLSVMLVVGIEVAACQHRRDVAWTASRPPTNSASRQVVSNSSAPPPTEFAPVIAAGIENAHRVTPKIISGAQPEGDAGFKALRDMGIKTVLSVDGATPDVAMAHKYGLRYVHLPITYSGVTTQQGNQIARALNELPGPIYVHCHHGKHRVAAAVAVACVENGTLNASRAETVLQTFGTGLEYKGLWSAARAARPLTAKALSAVQVSYVEVAKVPPLAEAMVDVDEQFDRIKLIQKSGWTTPASHRDLDPPHEALQLEEHFRELARQDAVRSKPPEFQKILGEAESASKTLRDALGKNPLDSSGADAAMKSIGASCAACHKSYRN